MTEQELALYRKCMRKRKRIRTRADYEAEHEYDIGANEVQEYDR